MSAGSALSNISRQLSVENQPLRIIDAFDHDPSLMRLQLHSPLDHPSNRARQQNMLKPQHPGCQRRSVIAIEHRHHGLRNDGAMVEFGRDQMRGRAMKANPGGQRTRMGIEPDEGRQQRRMDIDQTPGKVPNETVGENAHEAGEHDQIDLECVKPLDQRRIEGLAAGECR